MGPNPPDCLNGKREEQSIYRKGRNPRPLKRPSASRFSAGRLPADGEVPVLLAENGTGVILLCPSGRATLLPKGGEEVRQESCPLNRNSTVDLL